MTTAMVGESASSGNPLSSPVPSPSASSRTRKNTTTAPRWSGRKRAKRRKPAIVGVSRLVGAKLLVEGSPLAGAIETYLLRLESAKTLRTVTSVLIDFLRFARKRGVDPLDPTVARAFVTTWAADLRGRWAPLTRRRAISVIRAVYGEAAEAGFYAGADPTRRLPRISSQARNDPAALTADEVDELLAAADERIEQAPTDGLRLRAKRDRLALHAFLLCGLRVSELVSIRWRNRESYGHYRVLTIIGKGNKPAHIKLSPELDALFGEYCEAVEASGLVLREEDPVFFGLVVVNGEWPPHVRRSGPAPDASIMPLTSRACYAAIHDALGEIGRTAPRSGPHLLRRTSGTLLYEATRDLYMVQRHLRHSSPSTTTAHYIRQYDALADSGIDHLRFGRKDDQGGQARSL